MKLPRNIRESFKQFTRYFAFFALAIVYMTLTIETAQGRIHFEFSDNSSKKSDSIHIKQICHDQAR